MIHFIVFKWIYLCFLCRKLDFITTSHIMGLMSETHSSHQSSVVWVWVLGVGYGVGCGRWSTLLVCLKIYRSGLVWDYRGKVYVVAGWLFFDISAHVIERLISRIKHNESFLYHGGYYRIWCFYYCRCSGITGASLFALLYTGGEKEEQEAVGVKIWSSRRRWKRWKSYCR